MTSWPGYPPPAPPKPPWYRNLMVWLWVYVGFATVAVVAGFAFLFVFPFAFFAFVPSDPGTDYWVDQGSVNRAVMEPCDDMAAAGRDIKIFSTPAEGAESLHRFVDVGREIPDAISSVDDANSSALEWRDDWTTLLDALDAYADDLAKDPKAEFTPPEGRDGEPLMFSLSWVAEVSCELPPAIVALDPEGAADYYSS